MGMLHAILPRPGWYHGVLKTNIRIYLVTYAKKIQAWITEIHAGVSSLDKIIIGTGSEHEGALRWRQLLGI